MSCVSGQRKIMGSKRQEYGFSHKSTKQVHEHIRIATLGPTHLVLFSSRSLPISSSAEDNEVCASASWLLIKATDVAVLEPASTSSASTVKRLAADWANRNACVVSLRAKRRSSRFTCHLILSEISRGAGTASQTRRDSLVPLRKWIATGVAKCADQITNLRATLIQQFNQLIQRFTVVAVPFWRDRFGTAP